MNALHRSLTWLALVLILILTAMPALAALSSSYLCRKLKLWGAADLGAGPGNTLIVGNIGSSGEDGVLIDYAGGEGGGLHWQTIAPTANGLVINLSVGWEPAVGGAGTATNSYHQWSWNAGQAGFATDFSELGATGLSYELYLDGALVHSGAAPSGDLGGAFGELPNGFKCDLSDHIMSKSVGDKGALSQYQWDFAVPYDFGSDNVGQCNQLVVRPLEDIAIASMGDALLRLANIPSLVIDDAWLDIFGAELRGADDFSAVPVACTSGTDCDKVLRVDNNGVSEQQPVWVWVTYGNTTTSQGFTWDALPALAGTPLELGATGSVGGNPGSLIARGLLVENAGGTGYDLWTEFGTQPLEIMLRIEGEAALVPWDGTPLIAAGPPTGMIFGEDDVAGGDPTITYQWDIDTAMDISGRGTVVTGKIEFVSVGPLESVDWVDRVHLSGDTAALDGGWDITGMPNGRILNGSNLRATSTGVSHVYDFGPSGSFGVANIGSSGLDGVSFDLPAGTQTAAVTLPEPAQYAQATLSMVGRESGTAKAAGDIITFAELDLAPNSVSTGTMGYVDHGTTTLTAATGSLGGVPVVTRGPLDKATPILMSAWPGQTTGQAPNRAVVLEFPSPVDVDFGDGVLYTVDRLELKPDSAQDPVTEMMKMDMQFIAAPETGALEVPFSALVASSAPVSAVGSAVQAAPLRLHANYPNPFNPMTSIAFEMGVPGLATVEVYDLRGMRVRELVSRRYEVGRHTVVWDGRDGTGRQVASGTYFYRLEAGEHSETKRMALIK